MLNNKAILITGGTGSFGKKCTEVILIEAIKTNIFLRANLTKQS
ncbi:MAG: hypothetical protein FD156_108 [Nitrospirae bacterium]|nr:MAG: hypothetical protein FD156_108 [Nitrospirota bacterium]